MASDHDPHRVAAVRRALWAVQVILLECDGGFTRADLAVGFAREIEALADHLPDDQATPRLRKAAAHQALKQHMLAEYARLKPTYGRGTVTKVAERCAQNPRDRGEVETLARNLRNWIKKNGSVPDGDPHV